MNKTSMALTELAEKGPDVDMLHELLEFAAQRLMALEVENRCGAPYGERGVRGRAPVTATAIEGGKREPARSI